ncbi:hypothetical protein SAMN04488122_1534 [Chitinophaga arvensicola]|uniref:Uncharacterized protein n=1 Tax=Chitinophaga arvensicola TaxID=29529 RepID=A0A1I0QKS0_9BACT|nr:hypothetical protein SAMN04488122_1534 [Chitinophaga arvensicola]
MILRQRDQNDSIYIKVIIKLSFYISLYHFKSIIYIIFYLPAQEKNLNFGSSVKSADSQKGAARRAKKDSPFGFLFQ